MRDVIRWGGMATLIVIFLAGAVLAQGNGGGQEAENKEIKACRANGQIPVIDGDPNESAWEPCKGNLGDSFRQKQPEDGKPATESTKVAVLYDESAIYVAFWCYDSQPDRIIRELVRRDRNSESDYVEMAIDPFHDHQTGNEFVVFASGTMQDTRLYDDGNGDLNWDGVWDARVRMQPWGYSVEMKVPYHCLRFSPTDNPTWGINFFRYIAHKREENRWNYWPQSMSGFTSRMGHLVGMEGVKPAGHIELLPYGVTSMESQPKTIDNSDGHTYRGNAGVDVKYGISSDLVLDATINPDFGQVELDEPVLNLSTYETYYEEKRPFFLEGANLFNTSYTLFYSRRIGRSPRYATFNDPELDREISSPNSTTILGAARLTGKIAKRTTIAALTALTDEEKNKYVAISGADTVTRRGIVEPRASYSVVRVKQDFMKNSYVGGTLTVASQDQIHPATTGGIDWNLSTKDQGWVFSGQSVFSRIDPVNTGWGIAAALDRAKGKHIRGEISGRINSRDLNLNRLGYQSRANSQTAYGWLQYRTTDKWWIVSRSSNNLNIQYRWNFDGTCIQRGGNINNTVEFTNYWSLNTSIEVQGERYSDEETRGQGLWMWPEYPTYSYHMCGNTDPRKKISYHLGGAYGTDRGGDWWGMHSNLTLKPRSNVDLYVGMEYNKYNNSIRWMGTGIDSSTTPSVRRPVFGVLDWGQLSFSVSGSVLFNRNLSLQVSAEGLLNGLDYNDPKYYFLSGDRYVPVQNPERWYRDRDYSALNTMVLLRWEYLPGSTLYLVWTRANDVSDPLVNNLDFSRDMKRLFGAGSDNVFLLKMSYWMNI